MSKATLPSGQMAVIEDRAVGGAELGFASRFEALIDARALVLAGSLTRDLADLFAAAYRAEDSIRPTHGLKVSQAVIVALEFAGYVYQVHRANLLTTSQVCPKYLSVSSA